MILASAAAEPGFGGLFVALVIVAFFVALIAMGNRQRRAALTAAAEIVGATVESVTSQELTASARGFRFTFSLAPGGKNSPPHTYVDVFTPKFGMVLCLSLDRRAERGPDSSVVDVEVGDVAFDDMWIVEGAPAARVRRLFANDDLRRKVIAFGAHRGAEIRIEDGRVHLARMGYDYKGGVVNVDNLVLALDLADAVIIEDRLPSPEAAPVEGDYRAAPTPRKDDRRSEMAEVDELRRLRAARNAKALRPALIAGPIVITAFCCSLTSLLRPERSVVAFPLFFVLGLGMLVVMVLPAYERSRRAAALGVDRTVLAVVGLSAAAMIAYAAARAAG